MEFVGEMQKNKRAQFGIITGNTSIVFEKAENSPLNLTGKAKGYMKKVWE